MSDTVNAFSGNKGKYINFKCNDLAKIERSNRCLVPESGKRTLEYDKLQQHK